MKRGWLTLGEVVAEIMRRERCSRAEAFDHLRAARFEDAASGEPLARAEASAALAWARLAEGTMH